PILFLFGFGDVLLIVGLFRAFGRPQRYLGKVFGSVFIAIAFLSLAFFAYEIFYVLRQVPASNGAPRVGQLAPDFLLLDQNGNPVGLGDLLRGQSGPTAVALIFYRRFWWPLCISELRSLEQHLSAFDARGIPVGGIMVSPPEGPRQHAPTRCYQFGLAASTH